MRSRTVVMASPVSGQIFDDSSQVARVLGGIRGKLIPERELEKGAAGFLKAIERGLCIEPLQASEFGQAESLCPEELVERVDGIGARRGHSEGKCAERQKSYRGSDRDALGTSRGGKAVVVLPFREVTHDVRGERER